MNIAFKIRGCLLDEVRHDLERPHPFAYERVGYLGCRAGRLEPEGWMLIAAQYYPVADEDYVPDETVAAMIGPDAIRKALQLAYIGPFSMAHVHLHPHYGTPRFSPIDDRETAKMIPDFWNVRSRLPHAALVLSFDSLCGFVWEPSSRMKVPLNDFTIVGAPMKFVRHAS